MFISQSMIEVRIIKLGSFFFEQGTEGALPRSKPFKYTYEKEIVM